MSSQADSKDTTIVTHSVSPGSCDGSSSTHEKASSDDADPNSSAAVAHRDDDDGMHGVRLLLIMCGLCLASFLMNLDTAIVATAVPRITTQFHSLDDVGWYGAAYQLASAAMQPFTGKVYANLSLKWTFAAWFAAFELGSLLCGAARGSGMLVAGRAVAGLGAAGIQNGVFTIIAACVPIHRRPALFGVAMGVASFGLVVGPLIGGALTEYAGWRWCFYLNLPCGALVGAFLAFVDVPEQTSAPKPPPLEVLRDFHNRVDLVGTVLFAPAVTMLLLAVQWGGDTYAWDSSVIIGLFVGSGVTWMVWLAWDWHKKDAAMVPMSMVTKRNVWSGCLTYGFLMGPMFCASFYLPIYFQSVKGATPTLSGLYLLPSVVAQLIGAILVGKLVRKVGYYMPFSLLGAVFMAVGYGCLSLLDPHTPTGDWIGFQIIFGTGRGIALQMPLVAIQNTTAPAQIPIAMALAVFTATFGGSLALSFSDTIFTNSLRSSLQDILPSSTVSRIIELGGTGFRNLVPSAQLPTVLSAYSTGVDRVFYMLAAWAAVDFLTACGMGWKDIRHKKPITTSKA